MYTEAHIGDAVEGLWDPGKRLRRRASRSRCRVPARNPSRRATTAIRRPDCAGKLNAGDKWRRTSRKKQG